MGLAEPSARQIQGWLVSRLAEELRIAAEQIDVREPFAQYGVDSVIAVGLSGELEDWLGIALAPTVLWDYPTVASLADYLANEYHRAGVTR
jgi:8-amino-7-oxononanoate synthase